MWGVGHSERWNFSNSNISIWIFIVGIVNLLLLCECKKIDELTFENRIEIDRSEAEKYEFIHESCGFSLLFFQPNTVRSGWYALMCFEGGNWCSTFRKHMRLIHANVTLGLKTGNNMHRKNGAIVLHKKYPCPYWGNTSTSCLSGFVFQTQSWNLACDIKFSMSENRGLFFPLWIQQIYGNP